MILCKSTIAPIVPKRILIVSPTPTHPTNAGNRARILGMCERLIALSAEIVFLYVGHEGEPSSDMKLYWGERLHCLKTEKFYGSPRSFTDFDRDLSHNRLYGADALTYNYHVDDWYDENITAYATQLHQQYDFTHILAEYIFISRVLNGFGGDVTKVIDTHDCFTERYKRYQERGITPVWFSTYRDDERKALKRADIVIAVQGEEARFFEALSNVKTVEIGHLGKCNKCHPKQFSRSIGVVASNNTINIHYMNKFLETLYPKLRKKVPALTLHVGGDICAYLPKKEGLICHGYFDNLDDFYKQIDVVINPIIFSTGIKIKNMEALYRGKPLISCFQPEMNEIRTEKMPFCAVETEEAFIEACVSLLFNETVRDAYSSRALQYAKKYYSTNEQRLKEVFLLN